jgi:hypothetical protein
MANVCGNTAHKSIFLVGVAIALSMLYILLIVMRKALYPSVMRKLGKL